MATTTTTRPVTLDRHEPEVNEAVDALLDVALVGHYDQQTEDRFEECRICGDWEGHKDGCPIPALVTWRNT